MRLLPALLVPVVLVGAPGPKVLSPAGTVGRQIEMFNAHDIEGFLGLFGEALEVSPIPGGAAAFDKTHLRASCEELFRANPDLRASAEAQMVSGEFVIQKERAKGWAKKSEMDERVVIYQVKEGKIVRLWILGMKGEPFRF
jgi:hypothetical protein